MHKTHNAISHKMSKFLRHGGKQHIGKDGFVKMEVLLSYINKKKKIATVDEVNNAVFNCKKKRFTIDSSDPLNLRIRCNQGHNIKVPVPDLETTPITSTNIEDAGICAHGTTLEAFEKIMASGKLNRMNRYEIHFAERMPNDPELISGIRPTSQVVIILDVEKCIKDGIPLRKSTNNVILSTGKNDTGAIPKEYFKEVIML